MKAQSNGSCSAIFKKRRPAKKHFGHRILHSSLQVSFWNILYLTNISTSYTGEAQKPAWSVLFCQFINKVTNAKFKKSVQLFSLFCLNEGKHTTLMGAFWGFYRAYNNVASVWNLFWKCLPLDFYIRRTKIVFLDDGTGCYGRCLETKIMRCFYVNRQKE